MNICRFLDKQVFSVDTMNPEEGDIVLECDFKTELISHLLQRSGGRISVNIAPQYVCNKQTRW
jgi:myosin-1